MDTELLRKEVKKLMIDRGLDRPGSIKMLAKRLNCNSNMLNMALTGYRKSPRSKQILEQLLRVLLSDHSIPETPRAKAR